ncbi:hypothetical protein ACE6H2_019976 [Prunus campanulata]
MDVECCSRKEGALVGVGDGGKRKAVDLFIWVKAIKACNSSASTPSGPTFYSFGTMTMYIGTYISNLVT